MTFGPAFIYCCFALGIGQDALLELQSTLIVVVVIVLVFNMTTDEEFDEEWEWEWLNDDGFGEAWGFKWVMALVWINTGDQFRVHRNYFREGE